MFKYYLLLHCILLKKCHAVNQGIYVVSFGGNLKEFHNIFIPDYPRIIIALRIIYMILTKVVIMDVIYNSLLPIYSFDFVNKNY